MKTNEELQKDVQNAIKWEPLLNAAEIGVTVKDGVVTLTGIVNSYAKKEEAEMAAKNVAGVKVVVEKLEVKFAKNWGKTTDEEIATEIVNAFKWNWQVPNDKIKVKVESGLVTLDGTLDWNFEREAAKNAVKNLMGVMGVFNNIKIKSEITEGIEKAAIEEALERNWALQDNEIKVKVNGHKATLSGIVNSYYEKTEAAKIAFNAPGVWSVENDLIINYDYALMD